MISITFQKNHFKRTHIFFAKRPKISHSIGFYDYFRCESLNNIFGFKRNDSYTKLIDLTKSPDEILNHFNKTTRYQVKRAIQQEAKFSIEPDSNVFVDFYNDFARLKNLALMEGSYLNSFKNNLFISKAIHDDECLVMHANIIDFDLKRVHMFSSASHFRNVSNHEKRTFIGQLNRFLHFKDIIYAKNINMLLYDLGGYALNTKNKSLQNINKFKDGFGGELKRESTYVPYPIWLLRKFKRFMNL
jgi:lipid II:glycine glycyltransferase (peptidoglycan interpeptide bridge formation enzyme)